MADHESRVIAGLLRSARLTIVCADRGTDPAGLLRSGVLPLLRRRAVDQAVTARAADSLIRRAVNVVIPFPDRRRSREADRGDEPSSRTNVAAAEVVVLFDQWGPRPLSRLADALANAAGVAMAPSRLGEPERWARTLQEVTQEHRPRVLLVLDRFEALLEAVGTRVDATIFIDVLATTLAQEPPRLNTLLCVTPAGDGPPGDDAAWTRRLAPLASRCGPLDEHCVRLNADGRSFLLAEVERARAAAASRTMSAEAFRASIDAILMRSPPPGANDSRFIPSEFDAGDVSTLPAHAAPPTASPPTWTDPAEWLGGPVKRWPRPAPAAAAVTVPETEAPEPVGVGGESSSVDPPPVMPATPAPRPRTRSLPPLDLRVRPIYVVAPAALLLLLAVVIRLLLGDGDRTAPTPTPTPTPTPVAKLRPAATAPQVQPPAAPTAPVLPGISGDGSPRIGAELAAALVGQDSGTLRIVGFDGLRDLRGRVLVPLYSSELLFAVRADSPLRFLHDMRGQRVDAGEPGGTAALAAARVHERLFASGPPVPPAAAAPAKTVDAWLDSRASDVLVLATDDAPAWLAGLSPRARADVRLLHVDKTHAIDRRALQSYLPATVADGGGAVPTLSTLRFLVDTAGSAAAPRDADIANALCRALPRLQRDGHPKWRDVQPGLVVPTPVASSSTAQAAWRACSTGR